VKTLVLGIGNSILGDDGVGVHVAREVGARVNDKNVDVRDVGVDGLNLFDFILGYDRLVVIDAILTERAEVGEVYRLKAERVIDPSRSAISSHHFDLGTTLDIGKRLFPNQIPEEVVVYAVGTEEAACISEQMSPRVERAVPKAVSLVLEEIGVA
jgi:hydrogenase maturation protease